MYDVAKGVVFELMAVIDGVDVVAVADVFVGSGAEESPSEREEAKEIAAGEKGNGQENTTDAEFQEHGKIIALWSEIFKGEDTDEIGGKADDEEIVSRDTGRKAK